jgi:hypothetical protein
LFVSVSDFPRSAGLVGTPVLKSTLKIRFSAALSETDFGDTIPSLSSVLNSTLEIDISRAVLQNSVALSASTTFANTSIPSLSSILNDTGVTSHSVSLPLSAVYPPTLILSLSWRLRETGSLSIPSSRFALTALPSFAALAGSSSAADSVYDGSKSFLSGKPPVSESVDGSPTAAHAAVQGISAALLAGVVLGAVLLIAILVIVAVLVRRRNHPISDSETKADEEVPIPSLEQSTLFIDPITYENAIDWDIDSISGDELGPDFE